MADNIFLVEVDGADSLDSIQFFECVPKSGANDKERPSVEAVGAASAKES